MHESSRASARGVPRAGVKAPVIIHVRGPVASLDAAWAALLAPRLIGEHRGFAGAGGRVVAETAREAHGLVDGGRLVIPAGLVPLASTLLERRGRRVEIVDLT